MSKRFLEIYDDTICVKVPQDTTWARVSKNKLGKFFQEKLNLESDLFFQYGKDGAMYYDPDSFYLPHGDWRVDKIENGFVVLKR